MRAALAAIDRRDRDWLDRQPPPARHTLALPVLLRWASTVADDLAGEYMLEAINQRLNRAGWALAAHPELAFRLAASCGIGAPLAHTWLAGAVRATADQARHRLLAEHYPLAKPADLDLLLTLYDQAALETLARERGWSDHAMKDLHDGRAAARRRAAAA